MHNIFKPLKCNQMNCLNNAFGKTSAAHPVKLKHGLNIKWFSLKKIFSCYYYLDKYILLYNGNISLS